MRQGLALVRGALIATACLAVPFFGPAAAHALKTPPVSVSVGDTHVSVPSTPVNVPQVPAVPNVNVPGPVGGAANGVINQGNNVIGRANGALNGGGGGGG